MTAVKTRRLTLTEIGPATFEIMEPGRRYRMTTRASVTFELDRVRRDRYEELWGELTVSTELLGTDAVNGILSRANFNVSSARSRSERAVLVSRAAKADELPWASLIEDFCIRVLEADRSGLPSVDLRTVDRDVMESEVDCHSLKLPIRHQAIAFGDGGGLKSYIGLFLAGEMSRIGYRVGFFDWELAAEDHRDRLERLFGVDMPEIRYVRCERPLTHECDRLCQVREQDGLDFAVYDSIAFACDGPPEAAEVAARYFQATRQIRIGGLHLAHVNKSDTGDQKPFGSAYWHNGARATWFVKPAETLPDASVISVGLFPRKRNLGALPPPVAYEFAFDSDRTHFRRIDVADVDDLAARMPLRLRMAKVLRRGALTPDALAAELDADLETIKRTARRHKQQFTVLPGGRLGLLERGA